MAARRRWVVQVSDERWQRAAGGAHVSIRQHAAANPVAGLQLAPDRLLEVVVRDDPAPDPVASLDLPADRLPAVGVLQPAVADAVAGHHLAARPVQLVSEGRPAWGEGRHLGVVAHVRLALHPCPAEAQVALVIRSVGARPRAGSARREAGAGHRQRSIVGTLAFQKLATSADSSEFSVENSEHVFLSMYF